MVLEGKIGFRSDDTEVVLEPGGFITKPRGQMHAMWNATDVPGRLIEIITPGGFENYFHELGELLAPHLDESGVFAKRPASSLHESEPFAELAAKYVITYGTPDWLPGFSRPSTSRRRLTESRSASGPLSPPSPSESWGKCARRNGGYAGIE
jgi:hypothetical protein